MSSMAITDLTGQLSRIEGGASVIIDTYSRSYQVDFDVFMPVMVPTDVDASMLTIRVEERYVSD